MRAPIAVLAGTAVLAAASQAVAAASVEIKDAVAQVTVIPEDRADVHVVVVRRNARLPIKVRVSGRTVIDGGLNPSRIHSCRGSGADAVASVAGLGDVPLKAMPQIVVRTPRDVEVTAGGAVYGAIGRAASVTLGNAGCGDWTLANVEGALKVSLAGTGDARAGSAGSARLRVAGSGDIAAGDVRGAVEVDLAGSGDVTVRSVAGPLDVRMAGSGDVTVEGGHATRMIARLAGSGTVVFKGVADSLQARVAGSGDVLASQVRGPVRKSVIGSGSVVVGSAEASSGAHRP
jgi:hypothetical protein